MTSFPVGPDDVAAARDQLVGITSTTPLVRSRVLSERLGGPVYLKCENMQRTGSYKVRGGYVRLARLDAEDRARGVVAASAGNHAQGVAFAAVSLGIKCTVFMPEGAPLPKIEATKGYGADVILHGTSVEESMAAAIAYAGEHGSVYVHPFDHPDVIAGQGTVGLEILEQCPSVRTIVVAVGGGGLASGVAIAAKAVNPQIRMIGVQAEAAAPLPASIAAGHPVRVETSPTMADGITVKAVGDLTFRILSELADRVLTVSEDALSRALLLCLERAKQVVEPAGAAAVAALLEHPHAFEPPVVAVLSGGNIDPLLLAKVLRHGLSAAGRYLVFRCRLSDRPGALAALLAELADLGANVLDIVHERVSLRLHVDEVEVLLQLETRGPGHCDEVISRLRRSGYTLIFG
ncbi:MAG TPA: threonine ammonia-lyase [Streptosporangiaceae bacterium]